jgi:hyperosmotically inducible protein
MTMDKQLSRNFMLAAGVAAALGLGAPAFAAPTDSNPSYPSTPPSSASATGSAGTDMGAPTGSPSSSASMGQAGVVSDTDLTTQVKSKLAAMPNLQGSNIVVSAKEGKVTLSGTVASKDAEKAAKSAAESVPGVRKVDDDLKTSSKPPSHPGK